MPPPNLPRESVSWKVNTSCNYRCTYCLQPAFDEGYPKDIPGTVRAVSEKLGRPFEIKIAGGEVVASKKKAIELTKAISSYGHWLSMCTNFWAELDTYKEIIDLMDGRFYHIQASLHLEYADPDAFLAKCLALIEWMPPEAKLVVNNVIPDDRQRIENLARVKSKFEAEGVCFYTDLLVDKVGRYQPYSDDNQRVILELLGEEERRFESEGLPCRAGHTYFILLPNLDAWSCWDSYLRDEKDMFLGNIRDPEFRLHGSPIICPFDTCSCPTPLIKHRFKLEGMIPQAAR